MLASSDHDNYSFWNLPHSASLLRPLCHLTPVAAPPLSEEAGSLLPVGVVDGGLVIACWSLGPLHSTLYASSSRPGGDLCWSAHAQSLPQTHRRSSGLLFQRLLQHHNQSVSPTMMRTIAALYSVIQLTWIMCCDIFTHFNYPAPLSPRPVRLIWECTN